MNRFCKVFLFGVILAFALGKAGFLVHLTKLDHRLVGFAPFITPDPESWFDYDDIPDGSLQGKVALVTGANIGLGYWTAYHLARKGAHVVMACRSTEKCKEAAKEMGERMQPKKGIIDTMQVDVSSLVSVRKFVNEFLQTYKRLDIVVANAGISPRPYSLSVDGIETTFATNHLGHFAMLKDFEDMIVKTAEEHGVGAIVFVSSAAHYDPIPLVGIHLNLEKLNDFTDYSGLNIYGQTKLANVLHMQELASRLASTNVYVNAAHPGMVHTAILESALKHQTTFGGKLRVQIFDTIFSLLGWTPEDGARTQFYLAAALSELKAKNIRGQYFHPMVQRTTPSPFAYNMTLQKGLWDFSEELLKLKNY